MADMTWLATESKKIHEIFVMLFYGFATTLLLIGVFLEYFKWPLGSVPQFATLVGRALIAAIMLHTFSEFMNLTGDFADGLAKQLGDLNQIKLVLARSKGKLHELTWSFLSVKESIMLFISFVAFFLLYLSVHLADACMLYVWTLLWVFSPILIALYILPQTAGTTKALYRSVLEVSSWKIVWSVLATLLWSAALGDLNKPGNDVSFISAICFNLMLALSLVATPKIVSALASGGLPGLAGGLSVVSAALALKATAYGAGKFGSAARKGYNTAVSGVTAASGKYFPSAQSSLQKIPLMRTPTAKPSFFKSQSKPKTKKESEKPVECDWH